NIRVSPPERYAGDDNIEMFETWLTGLLRWFQVYNVTGNHKDSLRVDLCGTTLTGLAATWYADEVESWNRTTRVWLFKELICHLYKQFIHEVTAPNMATSYQKTKFSKTKGALAYYNELKHHASCIVQPPDEYSMKRKFLGGLPDDLVKNLFKSCRVTVEHTPIDKLLREAKAMESSIQAIHNYRSDRLAASKLHSSTTANVTNTQMSNCNPHVVRFVKRSTVTHNPSGPNIPHSGTASTNRHTSREANGSWHKTDRDKGARQNLSRSSGNVSHQKDSLGNAPKNTPLDDVECWRCHKKRHYSSSCPNTQRVFAAQVIEEDGETEPQIPTEKLNDDI